MTIGKLIFERRKRKKQKRNRRFRRKQQEQNKKSFKKVTFSNEVSVKNVFYYTSTQWRLDLLRYEAMLSPFIEQHLFKIGK